eukprot:TRINITY_DN44411_c0_g1_i1.p1 TRINITY_DN44411_c0_g1~~TRINITY_DN44411_c0_g1_i1.p1  ORF type:complete len:499 (+),score=76.61 TRINITY_DN44411_c0_g1_i1:89-1585(+)
MIVFQKGWLGYFIIVKLAGASWPHGIIPGLISTTIGIILTFVDADDFISDDKRFLKNHYPFQLFAYLVGFVVVFRTNFAYKRYWFSLDAVQRMSSKWLDGACMTIAFDAPGNADLPFLANSVQGESGAKATDSADAASGPAGMSHSEFFIQVVHLFSLLHAVALQHLRLDENLENLEATESQRLTLVGKCPSYHHYHRGLGWDLLDFSEEKLDRERRRMKLKVLGALTPEELKTLERDSWGRKVTGEARVTMVCSWILRRMIARQKHEPLGDMGNTSPPVLSRMYQVMSDGMLAYSQATIAATIPFPFPYHNLTQVFLWMYAISVPCVINAKMDHPIFRAVLTFAAVWSYFSISAVGDNLEDPYLPYDPNDLPLTVMQHMFNAQLVSFGVVPEHKGWPRTPEATPRVSPRDRPPNEEPEEPLCPPTAETAITAPSVLNDSTQQSVAPVAGAAAEVAGGGNADGAGGVGGADAESPSGAGPGAASADTDAKANETASSL